MEYINLSFLSVLQDLMKKIFDAVLAPVIREVTKALFQLAGSLVTEIFVNFILRIYITLLKLVDLLEAVFNIFSGISPIRYLEENTYFLDLFFSLGAVKEAFLLITLIAAAASFLFTMYATAKSISDMALEEKNPISSVLKNAMKSMLMFLLIPLLCMFLLQLATTLTKQINTVFAYTEDGKANASMGDILFITAAGEAAKTQFAVTEFSSGKRYEDPEAVKDNFEIGRINYVVGFVGTILVCFIMLGAILLFIRRVVEVLILYLTAPFFASAIPADGGTLFGKWRDLFVAKIFSGFGSIFSMKIYFLLGPALAGKEIVYSQDTGLNYCMQLFLVIGGAWAVYKGQHLILELLNPDAASAARQSTAGMAALVGGISSLARGQIGKSGGKNPRKGGKRNAPEKGADSGSQGQARSQDGLRSESGLHSEGGMQGEKDLKDGDQAFTGK